MKKAVAGGICLVVVIVALTAGIILYSGKDNKTDRRVSRTEDTEGSKSAGTSRECSPQPEATSDTQETVKSEQPQESSTAESSEVPEAADNRENYLEDMQQLKDMQQEAEKVQEEASITSMFALLHKMSGGLTMKTSQGQVIAGDFQKYVQTILGYKDLLLHITELDEEQIQTCVEEMDQLSEQLGSDCEAFKNAALEAGVTQEEIEQFRFEVLF